MTWPVFRYLLRDVVCRWREHPLSVLARMVVVAVLSGMAMMILLSLHLSTQAMRAQLEAAGARSVIVREFLPAERRAERGWVAEALASRPLVERQVFTRLSERAETDLAGKLPVLLVGETEPWWLGLRTHAPLAVFSDALPAGLRIEARVRGLRLGAEVRPRPAWLDRLAGETVAVGTREQFAAQFQGGEECLTYLEVAGGRAGVAGVAAALRALAEDGGRRGVSVRDPLPLIDRLEEMEAGVAAWRAGITAGFGGAMALVLGVIAFLEFRERRFVCALLRCFGLHPGVIFFRYAVDALALANAALVLAALAVTALAPVLLPSLGVPAATFARWDAGVFYGAEGRVLLGCVNLGALLGLAPTVWGVRQAVGRVLS